MTTEKKTSEPVIYTESDVKYREDLLKKIMTCDHVIGVMVAREDSPMFINQMQAMKGIFLNWYEDAVNPTPQQGGETAQSGEPDPGTDPE